MGMLLHRTISFSFHVFNYGNIALIAGYVFKMYAKCNKSSNEM
jgi:hypothetical protein